jgi:hypothetical protein
VIFTFRRKDIRSLPNNTISKGAIAVKVVAGIALTATTPKPTNNDKAMVSARFLKLFGGD